MNVNFQRQILFPYDQTTQQARSRTDADSESAIDKIDRPYRLTKAQRQKLTLAGRIDRGRFFDRLEATPRHARGETVNLNDRIAGNRNTPEAGRFRDSGVSRDRFLPNRCERCCLLSNLSSARNRINMHSLRRLWTLSGRTRGLSLRSERPSSNCCRTKSPTSRFSGLLKSITEAMN